MKTRWIVGTFVAIFFAALFTVLGFWQLARNQQKHDKIRSERAAFGKPAPPILDTNAPTDGSRLEAAGTYDPDPAHETILRDQPRGGQAGVDVLTPVKLPDGTVVLVDRGWVATSADATSPPAGAVVVRGLAHPSSAPSAQGTVERDGARLSAPTVDLTRIGSELPYRLRPVWIEAQYQQPAPGTNDPQLPEPAAPDPVNHMEYAIQWFAFALIPLVGWPIVMWRRARRSSEQSTPAE